MFWMMRTLFRLSRRFRSLSFTKLRDVQVVHVCVCFPILCWLHVVCGSVLKLCSHVVCCCVLGMLYSGVGAKGSNNSAECESFALFAFLALQQGNEYYIVAS